MITETNYTCTDCFNEFRVNEGVLRIQSETYEEFTCNACESTPLKACGACGELYRLTHECEAEAEARINETFDMRKVAYFLAHETLAPCFVTMTGGNCATLYLGEPDEKGFYPVACGVGSYEWENRPNYSPAYYSDFWIGEDSDEDDDDSGYFYKGEHTESAITEAIKNYFVKVTNERKGLKEYEVQVSLNAFAYQVIFAKSEEEAEELARAKPLNVSAGWKFDTDYNSIGEFQVREMDGEGGYMTAEERANFKN